ncbi:unnamed protein product (macronuclear) [Paramecium tetraurelia]|uniref:Uncharacterized protein n=1 Tax=Paramecium tetraurelia TaxID=5888 RepID=A0BQH9_PARTE|nr:uncharacterized protein GSPATT00031025001 [Paramecium tetraurelia]CAK60796.1 unnamed protein product [Paramecium tetraurelia]|eukprot:XP_001428194.1 hypothetical protein (macronuclear) [Paramecium tetraurelia strain d4-2]
MIFSFFYSSKNRLDRKRPPLQQARSENQSPSNYPHIYQTQPRKQQIGVQIQKNDKSDETDEEDMKSSRDCFLQIGTSEASKLINHKNRIKLRSVSMQKKQIQYMQFREFDNLDQIAEEQLQLQFQNLAVHASQFQHP